MRIDPKYLHQTIPDISFDRPLANLQLANILYKFMTQQRGIGLAANQVGYQKRLFVMNADGENRFCFNPVIVEFGTDHESEIEGCLSYPKQFVSVARPQWIRVQYADYQGQVQEETLTGLAARCFQHELDHLNGITMLKRHKEQNHAPSES